MLAVPTQAHTFLGPCPFPLAHEPPAWECKTCSTRVVSRKYATAPDAEQLQTTHDEDTAWHLGQDHHCDVMSSNTTVISTLHAELTTSDELQPCSAMLVCSIILDTGVTDLRK